ncbi:MAG: Flp pilus assembly complex ATPase component TadA [Lentisphaeria bacterium]|nr:Flp pilus assembly complex ATPase component TadA [Lentisphaeria bacterium]
MVQVILKMPGQPDSPLTIPPGQYQVGSSEAVPIQLPFVGVSKLHCVLQASESTLRIADLGSSNGTFLNGQRIGREFVNVPADSDIEIGSVHIHVGAVQPEAVPVRTISAPPPPPAAPVDPEEQFHSRILAVSGIPMSARPLVQEIKKQAHAELLLRLNMKRLALNSVSENDLGEKARTTIHEILNELSIPLPEGVTQEKIENELYHEAIGLGPLEDLIARDDITEIMVNGPDNVYVEHKGVLYKTDTAFADDHQVLAAIDRIVSPLGRRIDESSPMVDARLKDGSRVNAIIPPLSLVGPSITIRKFAKTPLTVENLISYGSITAEIAHFLDVCVKIRKNILISGGTGSGKTTLLNILSGFLPAKERIITIEDAAELQLRQEHLVRLESRPANIEGKGEVTIRDLVRNSLRMRPDRIVIGECRGGEALDMLQAMNTGHDGSLTTIHANSPRDALARLETLVLMAGFDLPLRAIREQIASAISIIVQINREKDGSRKVVCVSEITKMEGDIITMQDLFQFRQDGWSEDGRLLGHFEPTGAVPTFLEDIRRANLDLDISMFTPKKSGMRGGV